MINSVSNFIQKTKETLPEVKFDLETVQKVIFVAAMLGVLFGAGLALGSIGYAMFFLPSTVTPAAANAVGIAIIKGFALSIFSLCIVSGFSPEITGDGEQQVMA